MDACWAAQNSSVKRLGILTIELDFWDYIGEPFATDALTVKEQGSALVRRVKSPGKKIQPLARLEPPKAAQQFSPSAPRAAAANADVSLTLKHFERRRETALAASEGKRLYLRVGDEVNHLRHEEWGIGVAMEVMTSSIPGGTCLVRVRFQDGQLRCFNNDLDNQACCYYFGVRRYWNPSHGFDAKIFGRV